MFYTVLDQGKTTPSAIYLISIALGTPARAHTFAFEFAHRMITSIVIIRRALRVIEAFWINKRVLEAKPFSCVVDRLQPSCSKIGSAEDITGALGPDP